MKISDVLRQMADAVDSEAEYANREQQVQQANHAQEIQQVKIDAQELEAGQIAQVVQAANNIKRAAEIDADQQAMQASTQAPTPNTHELTPAPNNDDTTNDEMFISPLQQKHELLKKATDTSNNVDQFDDGMDDSDDELAMLKKMAGIGEKQPSDTDEYGYGDNVEINPRKNAAIMMQLSSDEFDS